MADFGDLRLQKRFISLSQSFLDHPGHSIPAACGDWAGSKTAYRFFDNEKVTPAKMLEPHLTMLKSRTHSQSVVLAVQDSTYLNLDTYTSMQDLGFVESSNTWSHKGLVLHSSLAFTTQGECLGMLCYKIFSRSEKQSTRHEYMNKPIHEKESYRWVESLVKNIERCSSDTDIVTIGDRESDIYELFQDAEKFRTFYLVRSSIDRYVFDEEFPGRKERKLSNVFDSTKRSGYYDLEIPAHKGRVCRTAKGEIQFFETKLKPPQ